VDSEEGVGSCFHFTIDARIAQFDNSSKPSGAMDLEGLSVLIDDSAANRRILTEMVAAEGMKPVQVGSAEKAILELQSVSGTEAVFRLALIDCHMRGWTGSS
jgi:urease beta subunit